jgi:flagellar biogenesis protein FliO
VVVLGAIVHTPTIVIIEVGAAGLFVGVTAGQMVVIYT